MNRQATAITTAITTTVTTTTTTIASTQSVGAIEYTDYISA